MISQYNQSNNLEIVNSHINIINNESKINSPTQNKLFISNSKRYTLNHSFNSLVIQDKTIKPKVVNYINFDQCKFIYII